MRARLQELLGLDASCVGLKARTNELCDAVGAGEALQAQVAVLLARR
jgi:2C-methyl-D-erythritol 2,4-cyclodiphosphate synthase